MKKLSMLFIVTLITVTAGCGKTLPDPIEAEIEVPIESVSEEIPSISEEMPSTSNEQVTYSPTTATVLDEWPSISVDGVTITSDWTLRDFLASPLADKITQLNVKELSMDENGHLSWETIHPNANEIADDFVSTNIECYRISENGDEFFLTFNYKGPAPATQEELSMIKALDLPLNTLSIDGIVFDCQGITNESTNEEIKTILGDTLWNGSEYLYQIDDNQYLTIQYDTAENKITNFYFYFGN